MTTREACHIPRCLLAGVFPLVGGAKVKKQGREREKLSMALGPSVVGLANVRIQVSGQRHQV